MAFCWPVKSYKIQTNQNCYVTSMQSKGTNTGRVFWHWSCWEIQSSAVITRSNIVTYWSNNCRNWGRISIRCWIHKRPPYLTLTGELWVSFVDFFFTIDHVITAPHCIWYSSVGHATIKAFDINVVFLPKLTIYTFMGKLLGVFEKWEWDLYLPFVVICMQEIAIKWNPSSLYKRHTKLLNFDGK